MKKKIRGILAIFGVISLVATGVPAGNAYAEGVIEESRSDTAKCEKGFFGMRPWYQGLTTVDRSGNCVIGTPKTVNGEAALAPFIWTIILNVLVDLFSATGILSILFLIIGGYWYLRSGGEPALVARGKKTIQTAAIGTAIAVLATLVTNLLVTILINS